jgi:hypothetical protein
LTASPTESGTTKRREPPAVPRVIRYILIAVLSVVVFAGLYMGVRMAG